MILKTHCDHCQFRFGTHEPRYQHDNKQYHYNCYNVAVRMVKKDTAVRVLAYEEPPKAA